MSSRSARFTQLSALGLALQDCRIKLLAWGTFCANGAATCIGSSKARTLAQARHERWLKQGMSSDQSGARARHQRAQSCAHEKAPQAGLFQDLRLIAFYLALESRSALLSTAALLEAKALL